MAAQCRGPPRLGNPSRPEAGKVSRPGSLQSASLAEGRRCAAVSMALVSSNPGRSRMKYRSIERCVGVREGDERSPLDAIGRVVRIDPFDRQPVVKLVDEHAFAAARVEDARRGRQGRQIPANEIELGEVGRVELPVWRQVAMVFAAERVFPRPLDGFRHEGNTNPARPVRHSEVAAASPAGRRCGPRRARPARSVRSLASSTRAA